MQMRVLQCVSLLPTPFMSAASSFIVELGKDDTPSRSANTRNKGLAGGGEFVGAKELTASLH